jgi:hypothetical protein
MMGFARAQRRLLVEKGATQAFRHLYVLATQPRCVEAMDVDSKQLVYLPLAITLQSR